MICDSLFDDYSVDKFHFHVKIKYGVKGILSNFIIHILTTHLLIIMITKKDLLDLYEWGKQTKFPLKKAPTIDGYSNIDIDYYWVKSVKKSTIIRTKFMNDDIKKIYENDDILFLTMLFFMLELN